MLNLTLLPVEEKALVAVSGGRDSVALLQRLVAAENISSLEVVHVDHGIRDESEEEQRFVSQLAKRYSLVFHALRLDKIPHTETQAREARYTHFIRLANQRGCATVVTAHHREDQLETRIMNLLRGCSPKGLSGIPESRKLAEGISLVRPALKVSREWLGEIATEWREDKSNAVEDNVRNRLRLTIIPQLQSLFPRDVAESFDSLVELLEDDLSALDAFVPEEDILSLHQWETLPMAIKRRWLRKRAPLERAQLEKGILAAKEKKSVDLGRGIHLKIADNTLSLRQ